MSRHRILLLAVLIWMGLASFFWSSAAQAAHPLSMDEALAKAMRHNPALKAVEAELGVAEAGIITAGTRPNPALVHDSEMADGTYDAGIEQLFELGGKRKKRIKLAQAEREALRASIQVVAWELQNDVRAAYTDLFVAQERVKLHQENLEWLHRLQAAIHQQWPENDELRMKTEVEILRTQTEFDNTLADLEQGYHELNALLGESLDAEWEVSRPPLRLLASLDEAQAVSDALSARPEIQQSMQTIAALHEEFELVKAQRIPDLLLGAGPQLTTGPGGRFRAFVSSEIALPVFDRQQGPLQELSARQLQLEYEQAALGNQISLETANLLVELKSRERNIRRYEQELIPKSRQLLENAFRHFLEGEEDFHFMMIEFNEYLETSLDYLETLENYMSGVERLESAIGQRLPQTRANDTRQAEEPETISID